MEKETSSDNIKEQSKEKDYDQYWPHQRMGGVGIVIAILIILFIALGAFWLGQGLNFRHVNVNRNFETFEGGGMMSGGYGGGHMFGQGYRNGISGQITNIDGNNLTLKNSSVTTYTVILSSQTSFYNAGQIAKQSDLKVNDNISAQGAPDSNGNIQASIVQFSN